MVKFKHIQRQFLIIYELYDLNIRYSKLGNIRYVMLDICYEYVSIIFSWSSHH